jgi:predicted site-specific integrase-resolvase
MNTVVNERYISASKISKQFEISSGTLRLWAESGKIKCLRPNGDGRRLYNVSDVRTIFGIKDPQRDRRTICYARVSSNHQKQDLERQVELFKSKFPDTEIIQDIESGLNWKRQGLNTLLELASKGHVETVVVTYRDRLCRFGFELLEWVFKKFDVKLLVLNTVFGEENSSNELAEDLLAITTVFVAKSNGLRAGKYRRERALKEVKESQKTQDN